VADARYAAGVKALGKRKPKPVSDGSNDVNYKNRLDKWEKADKAYSTALAALQSQAGNRRSVAQTPPAMEVLNALKERRILIVEQIKKLKPTQQVRGT
jgi:hypothetical protein